MLRYLSGTKHFGNTFCGDAEDDLSTMIIRYTDSDWAEDLDTRQSTSGYVLKICSAAISLSSKLQATPALSSTEAEYMAVTRA